MFPSTEFTWTFEEQICVSSSHLAPEFTIRMSAQWLGITGFCVPSACAGTQRGGGGITAELALARLPCCLELGMTLQLTGAVLLPLALLPLQLSCL